MRFELLKRRRALERSRRLEWARAQSRRALDAGALPRRELTALALDERHGWEVRSSAAQTLRRLDGAVSAVYAARRRGDPQALLEATAELTREHAAAREKLQALVGRASPQAPRLIGAPLPPHRR